MSRSKVSGVLSDTPASPGYLHLHLHIPISALQSPSTQNYGSQAPQSFQPNQAGNYGRHQRGNTFQHGYSWRRQWQHKYAWSKPGRTYVESHASPGYEIPSFSQPSNQFQGPKVPSSYATFTGPGSPGPIDPQGTNQVFIPPTTSQQSLGDLYAPPVLWHVGIYIKLFSPFRQMCGGSLVKSDVVLTAGHCFCNEDADLLDATLFAVAAGKLARSWDSDAENYTQHSDVKELRLPQEFQGTPTNFEHDIAIVLLSRAMDYTPGVKPICISFDFGLEQSLLTRGNLGTVAGWSFTAAGPPSQRLKTIKLPYMNTEECLQRVDPNFLKFITSDKICAGDGTTGVCLNDVGGGLAYTSGRTPYLLGVASAPRDNCNPRAIPRFTRVRAHRKFLEENVPGIAGCGGLYDN